MSLLTLLQSRGGVAIGGAALGLAVAASGAVAVRGSGGAALGVAVQAAATVRTTGTGTAELGMGAFGAAQVRVRGTGTAPLGLAAQGAAGLTGIYGVGTAPLGLAAQATGTRQVAAKVLDASGLLVVVEDGSTGAVVVQQERGALAVLASDTAGILPGG